MTSNDALLNFLSVLSLPHPWHGIELGEKYPDVATSFIECTPYDQLKFEVDKTSGYLKVDRPHRYSSSLPALYGFLPRTYCGNRVAGLCNAAVNRTDVVGDGDPLDILVLSSSVLTRSNIILDAIPIGGFRMIDGGEADDKIIAVLKGDPVYGTFDELKDLPAAMLSKLKHYFLTYKKPPDSDGKSDTVLIPETYGSLTAKQVMLASKDDYDEKFGSLRHEALNTLVRAIQAGDRDDQQQPASKKQKK